MPGLRARTHRHCGWLAELGTDERVYGPPPADVGFNLNPMGQDAKLTVSRSEQGGS